MARTDEFRPGFRIRKRGYSRRPWRIIDPEGRELQTVRHLDLLAYPGDFHGPAAFDTQAEAAEWLGDYAWALHIRLGEQGTR